MKHSAFLLFAFLILSCNNNTTKKEDDKSKRPTTTSCYISAKNQDTVFLQLKDSNNILTGELNYLPYEKDGQIGNLYDIKLMGDTLFAMYKSTQEGIETISEMAMLKQYNKYILTDDVLGSDNYKYDSSYNNGKFIAKEKITFKGDTLMMANCK